MEIWNSCNFTTGEGDTVLTGGGEGKGPDENGSMDIDSKKVEINGKTLRDEHGTYPVWVSSRKIAKIKGKGGKAKNKTTKHVEGKIVKKKGVVRKPKFK